MTTFDPAWLDAQYNARAAIPDHAAIFERWRAASALTREKQAGAVLDIAYGDGPGETLDVFPAREPGSPVLVFVHGGYWRSLDKSDHSFVAPAFVEAGAMVVVPNYALCPTVSMETLALQVMRAIAWTARHAADHGGHPRRIVVAGHSAGGHLAALSMVCRWPELDAALPDAVVRSALSISGLHDLEPIRQTPFLAADLRLDEAAALRLSPAAMPAPPQGVLFAVAGGDESPEFHRQTQAIRDAWGPRTVPVCETVPGRHHLSIVTDLADPQARLHRLALELLGLAAP